MNLEKAIHTDLGITPQYCKVLSEWKAVCLVPSEWLNCLLLKCTLPSEPKQFGELSDELRQQMLNEMEVESRPRWKLINLEAIRKCEMKIHRLSKPSPNISDGSTDLRYCQLIHYVTETNYVNLWKQAWQKYCSDDSRNNRPPVVKNFNDVVMEIIQRLFKCPVIMKGAAEPVQQSPRRCSAQVPGTIRATSHQNLVQVLCAIDCCDFIYVMYEKPLCTLQHCVMFSPAVLDTSTVRQLFVVYELLHVLREIHNCGLYMGAVGLSEIFVERNLWVRVFPHIFKELSESCTSHASSSSRQNIHNSKAKDVKETHVKLLSADVETVSGGTPKQNVSDKSRDTLESCTERWIQGAISNFDYLMELNELSGRVKDNPRFHPVMPWIMNFSFPEGGWRDLTKSKFRLNKGDKQLDMIYESAAFSSNASHRNLTNILQSSAVMVPHHMSDVLTDITYYVYKARRLPKTVLCQHVRQKWVPAEYPSTVERLQEWTPDECIPEFFSDPTIFFSIHDDLPDLGVPSWCEGPKDFIKRHRAALESDHVSERLHHWIDLTFGYRLTGTAAIKSKNVCLPLVDLHTDITSYGMVQLFSHPHPHKLSNSLYFSSVAPKTFRNVVSKLHDTKDSGEDETSSESSGKAGRWKVLRSKSVPAGSDQLRTETRPENLIIILPKDYSPLAALKQLESFCMFTSRTQGIRLPEQKKSYIDSGKVSELHSQSKDMLVLGCLISEMSLSSHLKSIPDVTLEERYAVVLRLLKTYRHEVPRCFWQVIQLLLQLSPTFEPLSTAVKERNNSLPCRYPPISSNGLPPPSPHQLLQPLIRTIPFPSYFKDLYSFLQHLNDFSAQLNRTQNSEALSFSKQSFIDDIAKSEVCFAAEKLRALLPQLNAEAVDLLIPYLQDLFENPYTSLHAAWYLFNTVSQCLGPQQTVRKLMKSLIKVFDPDVPSAKHMKLYHRKFLLQLIVRLGLQNFLTHFMTILIEAVGGLRDFRPKEEEQQERSSAEAIVRRKSSHLQSPELQEIAEDPAMQLNDSIADKRTMYDDDTSHGTVQCLEGDEEKEAEIFDFDEASEESVKISKEPEGFSTPVKDEEKSAEGESFDPSDTVEVNILAPEDDDEDDDPDVIDALASPIAESKRTKQTAYSRSAPNLTSPLSQYKNSQESTTDFETQRARKSPELATDALNSMLSPVTPKSDGSINISDVSLESIVWLAHRLGPVLTASYVTRNLLRMLTLCYDGEEKREIIFYDSQNSDQKFCVSISQRWYSGDLSAFKVLECLSRVAALYGEHFIMLQYLPYIADLLTLCKKRVTATLESGLIGAMSLLQHIIPYLPDATLMDHLQDVIIKDILYLVIRLISSLRLTFPSGEQSRTMITCRLIDVIYIIGLRIGFEMTRKHLSSVLQRLFSCFDKVYDQNATLKDLPDGASGAAAGSSPMKQRALEEMRNTFTPEIAYLSYIPFCKLAGGIFMENSLKNDELIRHLCLKHDSDMAKVTPGEHGNSSKEGAGSGEKPFVKTHQRETSLGQDESFVSGVFGKNVAVVGNRLDVQLGDESHLVTAAEAPVPNHASASNKGTDVPKYDISLLRRKMDNNQRHLKGNWLAYWEHEKGRSEKDDRFNFKQIKLQSFVGHTGAIRTIQILDNENSFLTSSKDKTVKLWSLRSYGDGFAQSACQWTYGRHRKSVFAVSFLDSLRLVGSCDSTVHIWDPFMGSCIKQIEPTKGSPITVLASMPAPSTTFLAATTNSTVRFLDARTCRYMHEFKVSIGSTGLIRCLAVSPNGHWLAIGHSTGMISVLDVRTGFLFSAWMGHEGEILQLKAFDNTYFVTSSLDHCVSVWNSEGSQPRCHLKGPIEPVTNLCFYKGEVISATAGNKIGLHTSIDRKAAYSSTRLRSDTFKGMLTTMALLPLNRLLMLGADSGNLVLLS